MEKSLKQSSGNMPVFPEETTMDLLLWRHAEAEDGPIDLQRRLTARGEKQAKAMGRWLREHQPKKLRILASPAVRCQQTAKALDLPFETHRRLGPEAGVSDLIAASGWPGAGGSVMIVGHQPTLGRMAALLLSGEEADWTIKKGAVWWFTNRVRRGETQTVLRAVMPADLSQ
ncbi:MAG: phosphohistidine phosphatase, SixA [Rhodocyclaceae bacterium]|nr:phosphohistidine phosphatase, SixA [Rhodocyclaceae bacterium]